MGGRRWRGAQRPHSDQVRFMRARRSWRSARWRRRSRVRLRRTLWIGLACRSYRPGTRPSSAAIRAATGVRTGLEVAVGSSHAGLPGGSVSQTWPGTAVLLQAVRRHEPPDGSAAVRGDREDRPRRTSIPTRPSIVSMDSRTSSRGTREPGLADLSVCRSTTTPSTGEPPTPLPASSCGTPTSPGTAPTANSVPRPPVFSIVATGGNGATAARTTGVASSGSRASSRRARSGTRSRSHDAMSASSPSTRMNRSPRRSMTTRAVGWRCCGLRNPPTPSR